MTKKRLYGVPCLAFWIVLSLGTGFAQQSLGPRVFFEQKDYDAGEIRAGEMLEHSFTVFNKGDRPLKIKRVSPG